MKADIISVGTEILMGELVDTNSQYLAAQLPAMGIELQGITSARDDLTSSWTPCATLGSAQT